MFLPRHRLLLLFGGPQWELSWTYDRYGNRTEQTASSMSTTVIGSFDRYSLAKPASCARQLPSAEDFSYALEGAHKVVVLAQQIARLRG